MEEASSIAKAIETAWNRAGQPTEFSVKVLELPQTSFFGLKTSKSAKVAFFFNEATVTVKSKESAQPPRNTQQRPVTLRQQGNKSESTDQQRRPHNQQRYENRGSQEGREQRDSRDSSDRSDNRPSREPRENRENRGFEQRQDRQNRPQGTRRPEYEKNSSDRPNYAKPSPDRPDYSKPSSDRQDERPRRPEFNKSDRHDDRRPRFGDREGERSENGYTQERESWSPEMVQVAHEWIKETLVLMGKPEITVNTHVSHNYLKVNLSAPVLDDARQEETQLKSWGMLAMEAVREKAGKPLRSLRIILESNK